MDTIIAKVVGNVRYNKFGERLIQCSLCSDLTTMLGTKLCDRCWELSRRIAADPGLARKVLELLDK